MKTKYSYILMSIFLLTLSIIIASCGGGSDNLVSPNLNPEPALVTKDVSGFIYYVHELDGSQAGEEETGRFIILDTPITGEDAFLAQMKSSLEETGQWTPDTQEVYNLLTEEIAGYVPLPGYNGNAKLFSSYQDTRADQPLTVNVDGYFEGTVAVRSTDDVVDFIVVVGEEEIYEARTIASSNILNESQVSGELKSCPEMIIVRSGCCEIFKIYADPAVNLKDAGLTISLNNPELGYVTSPFYLRIKGKKNYNVAYAIFKANRGLSTPVDTTITASTSAGLALNIFTEVVGSTASVAGHIGGQGVIPKFGFVYSCGPWAFDFLDNEGNYNLNRVYQGHFRESNAVYWLADSSGNWVKHKETRVIDFLQGDLGDFHIPEWIQPEPTPRLALDPYYDKISLKIVKQRWEWQEELGYEQGIQKTVDWLNRNTHDFPLPQEIKEAIEEAKIDDYDPHRIWLYFKDGMEISLSGKTPWQIPENNITTFAVIGDPTPNTSPSPEPTTDPNAETVKSTKVLILAPFAWQYQDTTYGHSFSVYEDLATHLKDDFLDPNGKPVYQVDRLVTGRIPGRIELTEQNYTSAQGDVFFSYINPNFSDPNDPNAAEFAEQRYKVRCTILNPDNIINPRELFTMMSDNDYGIIFINTHGCVNGISCGPVYDNMDIRTETWINNNFNRFFFYDYIDFPHHLEAENQPLEHDHLQDPKQADHVIRTLQLRANFFDSHYPDDSIVYIAACNSQQFHQFGGGFSDAKVYLGNNTISSPGWDKFFPYYYFYYLIYGYTKPTKLPSFRSLKEPDPKPDWPMSVQTADQILIEIEANPDPVETYPDNLSGCEDCNVILNVTSDHNIYFPAPAEITVTEY